MIRSPQPRVLALVFALMACREPIDQPPGASRLISVPGPRIEAWVGEEVVLDGSASEGAAAYQWNFGDGRGWPEPRPEAIAMVSFDAPGRYQAVLTVFDHAGNRHAAALPITITHEPVFEPRHSSTIITLPGTDLLAVAVPDADAVSILEHDGAGGLERRRTISTERNPRTVARWNEWLAVACQDADVVELFRVDGSDRRQVVLPRGARPFGVVATDDALFVSLQGTGELAEIANVDGEPVLARTLQAVEDARGVSFLPDGRIAVTRWRSPDTHGEIAILDASSGERSLWPLRHDDQLADDVEIGGVPTYLNQVLISPDGREAVVPGLHANHGQGLFRNGEPLTFETTIRAMIARIVVSTGEERFERRQQFNDRGFAAAGVFSNRGDFVYLAMRGNRSIERVDALTGTWAGSIFDEGFAPDGLAISADDRFVFVDASLSRQVAAFDVSDFSALPRAISRVRTIDEEPLPPMVLRGKQLFNDSFDRRLGKDGYMACGHCHLDGETDNRTWDFTDRGEGLRNTISLVGRRGTGDGPLHWSANFDEVHDFEGDIRNAFLGTGLLDDSRWEEGDRSHPMGLPKEGLSDELDALAAYVASLERQHRSPHRTPGGALTADAKAGRLIFDSDETGCAACHAGPRLTDSTLLAPGVPLLHDVGTLGDGSGTRLREALTGLDAPTLHGLWDTAPYLHDGSAPTLLDVLTTRNPHDEHGVTSHLTQAQLDQLIAYLLSLDGRRD